MLPLSICELWGRLVSGLNSSIYNLRPMDLSKSTTSYASVQHLDQLLLSMSTQEQTLHQDSYRSLPSVS